MKNLQDTTEVASLSSASFSSPFSQLQLQNPVHTCRRLIIFRVSFAHDSEIVIRKIRPIAVLTGKSRCARRTAHVNRATRRGRGSRGGGACCTSAWELPRSACRFPCTVSPTRRAVSSVSCDVVVCATRLLTLAFIAVRSKYSPELG